MSVISVWAPGMEQAIERLNEIGCSDALVTIMPDHGMHGGRAVWIILRDDRGAVRAGWLDKEPMATIYPRRSP